MLSPTVLHARLLARARLRHLQLLVAVAECGSLNRAAERVGITQPAATQALADLEAILETPLFERHARGMRVSAAGQAVLPIVRQALSALESSMEALVAVLGGGSGLLRIGTSPAAMHSVLGRNLAAFCERHPDLRVEVVEGRPDPLLQDMLAGNLHTVLARSLPDHPARLRFELLLEDEGVVLAGAGHPLAKRHSVPTEELARWRWLRAPRGVGARDAFEALFDDIGTAPAVHPVATTSPGLVATLLGDGTTLTIAPRSIAQWYLDLGLVVRLDVQRRFELAPIGAFVHANAGVGTKPLAAFLAALRPSAPA